MRVKSHLHDMLSSSDFIDCIFWEGSWFFLWSWQFSAPRWLPWATIKKPVRTAIHVKKNFFFSSPLVSDHVAQNFRMFMPDCSCKHLHGDHIDPFPLQARTRHTTIPTRCLAFSGLYPMGHCLSIFSTTSLRIHRLTHSTSVCRGILLLVRTVLYTLFLLISIR